MKIITSAFGTLGLAVAISLGGVSSASAGAAHPLVRTSFPCAHIAATGTAAAGVFAATPHPTNGVPDFYGVTARYLRLDAVCKGSGVTVVLALTGAHAAVIHTTRLYVFTSQALPVPHGDRADCAWTATVYATDHRAPIASFSNPLLHTRDCAPTSEGR